MFRSREQEPTSIFDAAEQDRGPTGRSRGVRIAMATAVAAVVGTGSWFLIPHDDSSTNNVEDGDPTTSVLSADATTTDPATSHVNLLIDGWSYRTLDGRQMYSQVSEDLVSVEFKPATAADIAELLESTPDLVTQAMARFVTADPTLECDENGCATSAGDVSAEQLLDPASIAGLGESYRGYGVESGLYVAQVATDGSTSAVNLTVDGYDPFAVAAVPVGTEVPEDEVDPGDALNAEAVPSVSNGYLQGRFLIGAGLGQLFSPEAQWLGSDPQDPTRYLSAAAVDPVVGALDMVRDEALSNVAVTGLADALPSAQTWTGGHLTYATSPTTGCGPEALCVPDSVEAEVVRDVRDYAPVCSPGGESRGVVSFQDIAVNVTLAEMTHQYGLGDTSAWDAAPETVDGDLELRFAVLSLFDGEDTKLRAAGGRVDEGRPQAATLDEALGGVRFDGALWNRC